MVPGLSQSLVGIQFLARRTGLDRAGRRRQVKQVSLAERFCFNVLRHAVLEATAVFAQVLDDLVIDLFVHFEGVSAADHAFLLGSQHMKQRFELGSILFSAYPSFDNLLLIWGQDHELPLLTLVAQDLFLHRAIRVARAHLDNFTGEIDREAEPDGRLELQSLLARDASPLATFWPQVNQILLQVILRLLLLEELPR